MAEPMAPGGGCSALEPYALRVLGDSMEPEFPDGCVVIVYGEAELAQAVAERVSTRFHAAGIAPLDLLRVAEGRWFSLTCSKACCPPEGLPIPETSAASCEVAVAGGYVVVSLAYGANRLLADVGRIGRPVFHKID